MDQFYWAALGAAKGVDAARLLALVRSFGSPQDLYGAEEADILATGILSPERTAKFVESNRKNRKLPEMLQEQCERLHISVVPVVSSAYPERLKQILRPPAVLYVKGTLPDCRYSIGMAGSRMADAYGKKAAACFGRALAEAGVIVVSGGAKGIDTASHEGALQGGGKTVAVLGCSPDVVYPPENRKLFEKSKRTAHLFPSIRPEPGRTGSVFRSATGSSAVSARALCWCRLRSGAGR